MSYNKIEACVCELVEIAEKYYRLRAAEPQYEPEYIFSERSLEKEIHRKKKYDEDHAEWVRGLQELNKESDFVSSQIFMLMREVPEDVEVVVGKHWLTRKCGKGLTVITIRSDSLGDAHSLEQFIYRYEPNP